MPKIQYPRSDQSRIHFLTTCLFTAKSTNQLDGALLSEEILVQIEKFEQMYQTESLNINDAIAAHVKETREKNNSVKELTLLVRDFYEVLRRRTVRKKHPNELFTMYGLQLNGKTPPINNPNELFNLAQAIVVGEEHAIASGFPAMQNPDAQEIAEMLQLAKKEKDDVLPTDRALDQLQKELQSLRKDADELIREIASQLRFALRKNTSSNQRRIMKLYGFRYRYSKKETIED